MSNAQAILNALSTAHRCLYAEEEKAATDKLAAAIAALGGAANILNGSMRSANGWKRSLMNCPNAPWKSLVFSTNTKTIQHSSSRWKQD